MNAVGKKKKFSISPCKTKNALENSSTEDDTWVFFLCIVDYSSNVGQFFFLFMQALHKATSKQLVAR